jgi:hypothetical protein
MPLSAINFVTKGPVLHADMLQFYNLFTGVMLDQPVTFKNVLTLGGNQGSSTVPLKLYGAIGQTGHLIDLYADTSQAQPGFGFGANGAFGWGPGGAAPVDTNLSRVGTQNGHASDTAGLLVSPYLEVNGNISATTYLYGNGASITGPGANPLQLTLNQDLLVNRNIYLTNTSERIRYTGVSSAGISVDSTDGSFFGTSSFNAHLASNAYWDNNAANWLRYRTSVAATVVLASIGTGPYGFQVLYAPAGTGNITWNPVPLISVNASGQTYHPNQGYSAWYDTGGNPHFGIGMTGDNMMSLWTGPGSNGTNGYLVIANAQNTLRIAQFDNSGNMQLGSTGTGALSCGNITMNGAPTLQMGSYGVINIGGAVAYGQLPSSNDGFWDAAGNIRIRSAGGGMRAMFDTNGALTIYGNSIWFGSAVPTTLYMNPNNTAISVKGGPNSLYLSAGTNANVVVQADLGIYVNNAGSTAYTPCLASAFQVNSTRWRKSDIVVLDDALSMLMDPSLHGYRYTEKATGQARVGFVSDDWNALLPQVVSPAMLGEGTEDLMLNYDAIGAVTFEALKQYVQQTNARIAALEARLAA